MLEHSTHEAGDDCWEKPFSQACQALNPISSHTQGKPETSYPSQAIPSIQLFP